MSDERVPTPPDGGPIDLEQTDNRPRPDDPAVELPQDADLALEQLSPDELADLELPEANA